MRKLSFPLQAYIIFVFILACALIYYVFKNYWTGVPLLELAIFLILASAFDIFQVELPRGGRVAVTSAIYYAIIFLFGPAEAILVGVLGELPAVFFRKYPIPWYKQLFNSSQAALSIGLAGLVYWAVYPLGMEELGIQAVLGLVCAAGTFFLVNTVMVAVVFSLAERMQPWQVIRVNMKGAIPNFLALGPLGMLLAVIYHQLGVWGVLLFCVPLVIARSTFQAYTDMRQMYLDTVQSLAAAVDAKDQYTKGHSERVADYAVKTARMMGFSQESLERLQFVALLHDTGKIGISENILNKKGELNREEFQEMARHSVIGSQIVSRITLLREGAEIVRHHHEHFDGRGYPDGVQGEEIPLFSRIIAVADAFDAMTSDRPYRKAMSPQEALVEIKRNAGSQFDPQVAAAFEKVCYGVVKE